MSEDVQFLGNYRPDQLYVNPAKTGAYATIVGNSEVVLGEIDVTSRCKLAVSAYWVNDKSNFGTFKITKITHHKTYGWREDSSVKINDFQLSQMAEFLAIISNLNLSDVKKTRVSLNNVNVGALGALLSSSKGAELIKELAETPELHQDIYAVASKRKALVEFEKKLCTEASEKEWQNFFEANQWIFGHGLNYVALDKVAAKLEATTTGAAFDQHGKRTDALVRTRAEVSQYILVEIKKNTTELLARGDPYRVGCWAMSDEVSNAVTQIQKTAFDFAKQRFRDGLKDSDGNDTGETVYSVEPKSFLIVGNLAELHGNDDKVACFELYRRNIRSPEIITFDELFYRAQFIVENISRPDNLS